MMDDVLEKVAAVRKEAKPVGDGSEPTTHPVENADAGTSVAQEGARSAENEADVKKDYGTLGNTGQEDANVATSEKPTDTMGTQSQAADEVKGNVQEPKSMKDDPEEKGRGDGSPGHPSNTTFNENERWKFSSAKDVMKAGEQILAGILAIKQGSSDNAVEKKTEETKTEKKAKPGDSEVPEQKKQEDKAKEAGVKTASEEEKRAAAQKYREDAEAGYMAAELLARQLGFGKEAEDQTATAACESLMKKAEEDADVYCSFLAGHVQGGNEGKAAISKKAQPELMAGGGGEIPPEVLAAAAGGGGGGEEMIEPGVMAEDAGGGDEEALLEELAAEMAQEGVSPEELVSSILAEEGGGGEELAAPGLEAAPEMAPGVAPGMAAAPEPELAPAASAPAEGGGGSEGGGEKKKEEPKKEEEKEGAAFMRKKAALLATMRGLMRRTA
jgi:hypothetical protein